MLYANNCTSSKVIEILMMGKIYCLPNFNFPVSDVRDVALAHLKAMILDEAKNNRHVIVSRHECLSFKELALTLENEFKSRNYLIPTRTAPDCSVKLLALFDNSFKQVNKNYRIILLTSIKEF